MDAKTLLENLKKDLLIYNDSIKEVAKEIIDNEFSRYPIFIAHQINLKIGEVIFNRDDLGADWSINATTAEELIEKKYYKKIASMNLKKFIKIQPFLCAYF